MKKYIVGTLAGLIGAIINIAFLLFAPDIDLSVYISTGITWLVSGLLISASNLKLIGALKGILISLLVSAPSLVFTFVSTFIGALWTVITIVIVGAVIGFIIEKIITQKSHGGNYAKSTKD